MSPADLVPSVLVIEETSSYINNVSFDIENIPAFLKQHAEALGLSCGGCLKIEAVEADCNSVKISKDSVLISYVSDECARQALGYIAQLVIANYGSLPICSFSFEVPAFSYRGYMLDTSRHFLPVDELIRFLRFNSMQGYNVFHWHLTDDQGWRFSVPGYDKLETISSFHMDPEYPDRKLGGFFSDDDIRKVVEFASRLGITVIPEVDMPGHSRALLAAYPEFGCREKSLPVEHTYGVFKEVLNPFSEELWVFLDRMMAKLSSLFPSPYFHIGGDECPHVEWVENKAIAERMKAEGIENTDDLQGYFTSRMAKLVSSYGKRSIGWDEVLAATDMPSDVIIMSWRGMDGAAEASRRGQDAIVTSCADGCYFDYAQSAADYEAGNLGDSFIKSVFLLPIKQGEHILGGQWNLWTEKITSGRIAEYMAYPRSFALAEVLWLGDARDWKRFAAKKRAITTLCSEADMVCSPGSWE